MKRAILGLFILGCFAIGAVSASAQDAAAVIDKAIKAHGGEEALGKIKAYSISAKSKLYFGGNESEATVKQTVQGITHLRQEFEGEFGGNAIHGVTVQAGDKLWNRFNDMDFPMEEAQVANTKRTTYMNSTAVTLLPLKSKEFKTALAGEEKVGDKLAAAVKVTGPDGKDFTMYFDKESGLLVKVAAEGVLGFGGDEAKMESTYSDYKEVNGVKKAMKSVGMRNGEKNIEQEVTEFKVLDKAPDGAFDEPK
jgi:outer membrane lipoprotein-sorting protein